MGLMVATKGGSGRPFAKSDGGGGGVLLTCCGVRCEWTTLLGETDGVWLSGRDVIGKFVPLRPDLEACRLIRSPPSAGIRHPPSAIASPSSYQTVLWLTVTAD